MWDTVTGTSSRTERIGIIGACGYGGFALNAVHIDLYDNVDKIPFDKIEEFLNEYLKK